MKNFIISEELLQAVGSYLLSKPMVETRRLVEALEKLQEFKKEDSNQE